MAEQNDNHIPAWSSLRQCDSPLIPSRPASEGDEDVLASIARRHASSLGIRQAVRRDSPQAVRRDSPPLRDSTDRREAGSKDVFYVRRAICKSPDEPVRGEFARSRFARGRPARVLVVYLVFMAVLTAALCFMTWLDEKKSEEFAQTSSLVDVGGGSQKTEDPEAETRGHRNTVIVVDR